MDPLFERMHRIYSKYYQESSNIIYENFMEKTRDGMTRIVISYDKNNNTYSDDQLQSIFKIFDLIEDMKEGIRNFDKYKTYKNRNMIASLLNINNVENLLFHVYECDKDQRMQKSSKWYINFGWKEYITEKVNINNNSVLVHGSRIPNLQELKPSFRSSTEGSNGVFIYPKPSIFFWLISENGLYRNSGNVIHKMERFGNYKYMYKPKIDDLIYKDNTEMQDAVFLQTDSPISVTDISKKLSADDIHKQEESLYTDFESGVVKNIVKQIDSTAEDLLDELINDDSPNRSQNIDDVNDRILSKYAKIKKHVTERDGSSSNDSRLIDMHINRFKNRIIELKQ